MGNACKKNTLKLGITRRSARLNCALDALPAFERLWLPNTFAPSLSMFLSHSLLKLFFAKKLATSARGCLPRNWVKVSASGQALVANTQKSESSFSLSLSISFTLGPHLWLGGSMSAEQHSRTIDYIGGRGINTRTLTQGQW